MLLMALLGLAGVVEAAPRIAVDITGIEGPLLDNVRDSLSIVAYRSMGDLTEASVLRLHARATDEVRTALQPFGYYAPEVNGELRTVEGGWRASYHITTGPEVRLASVEVRVTGPGGQDAAFRDAAARLPLAVGDGLRHARYAEAKLRLQQIAEDNGYLDARFTENVLEVDTAALVARVRLSFDTGRQFRFGPVEFVQDFLDPQLVARYATFRPGEVFSVGALLDMQYALNDSDYFASVRVEPQREAVDAEGRIPVRVELSPRPVHRYTVGFGFGTDTGPRATLGFENRRLNRAGHRLASELRFSEIKQELEARLVMPLARPATERLTFQAGVAREEAGDTVSRKVELGVALTKQVGDWLQTAYLRHKVETSVFALAPDESDTLVVPGVTWSLTARDDPVYPQRGHRLVFDLHASHDGFGSDTTFAQYSLSARLVRALGPSTRVLLRGEVGGTWVDQLSELPVSERFFAGGDQSVRGYGYKELGPTDAVGSVVGGRNLLVVSAELEQMFGSKLGIALFADAGNAADSFSDLKLRRAVGVGLRWRSPVGMVRLDFGHALADPAAEPWRVHISIGPFL